MKITRLLLLFMLCVSFSALSQQPPAPPDPIDPPSPPDPVEAPAAPDMDELQRKLADAQRRLEEAAREVAEKSAQLYQNHMPQMERIRIERGGTGKGAMLGVHIETHEGDDSNHVDGVDVVGVTPNGPADKAGLKSGDRIMAINGQSLQWQGDTSPAKQLFDVMAKVEPEEAVTVDYVRDGNANSVIVETEKLNHIQFFADRDFDFDFDFDFDDEKLKDIEDKVIVLNDGMKSFARRFQRPWRDLELMALTPKLGSYFNTEKGVLVVSVGEEKDLKLEEGDVILTIDGREPKDPAHTVRILNSYQPGEKITFQIMRERRKREVEYTVPMKNEDVSFIWQDDGNNFFSNFPIQNRVKVIAPLDPVDPLDPIDPIDPVDPVTKIVPIKIKLEKENSI